MKKDKIKVLHIITRFILGGADENTLFTVNGLDKSRYELHLMIGNTFEDKMIKRLDNDIKLIKIMNMGREISPLKDFYGLCNIWNILRKYKYDIVHTHTSKAGFLGRIAGKLSGTRHIIHGVHTIPFADVLQPGYNGIFLLMERLAAKYTKAFISVGEDLKTRYIKEGIGSPDKYFTVYSGMDLEAFDLIKEMTVDDKSALKKEIGLCGNEMCIGIVSRLEPGKGFNYFPLIVQKTINVYPVSLCPL